MANAPKPITLSKEVAKKPDPSMPGGASTILMSLMIQNEKRFIPTKNEPQIYNILGANSLI
jgi:hypothetical protein